MAGKVQTLDWSTVLVFFWFLYILLYRVVLVNWKSMPYLALSPPKGVLFQTWMIMLTNAHCTKCQQYWWRLKIFESWMLIKCTYVSTYYILPYWKLYCIVEWYEVYTDGYIGRTCCVRSLKIHKPKKWCNNHRGGHIMYDCAATVVNMGVISWNINIQLW